MVCFFKIYDIIEDMLVKFLHSLELEEEMQGFGIDKIKEIIPHREPFLFLDEVLDVKPGEKILAKKEIKKDEFWIKGHFPNFAVCPGVLVVEMLAQAGAVCVLALPENKGKTAFFGGIKNARFKKQILPGDVVFLDVVMKRLIGDVGIGQAKAIVDEKIAVLAEITFALKKLD